MSYFLWGCGGILTLITLRSERVKELACSSEHGSVAIPAEKTVSSPGSFPYPTPQEVRERGCRKNCLVSRQKVQENFGPNPWKSPLNSTCLLFNPFTPESDQCQISPPAPSEILHHTSKENLAFHSLLRWKMIIIQILAISLMHFLFKRLGECTFWAQEWKG